MKQDKPYSQGLWEGGAAGTLFWGPTATKEPMTEGTFLVFVTNKLRII